MASIKQCDIKGCGNIEGVSYLFLYAGREMDAAGARDDKGVFLDICPGCESRLLRELLKDFEMSKRAAEIAKGWMQP
ncbi:hypothetical protein [Solidesulfovibrio sp.]